MPKRPIRTWQIWNEPNFKYFVAKPNPAEYGKLVKLSSAALEGVDPGAQGGPRRPLRPPEEAHRNAQAAAAPTSPATSSTQMYRTTPGIKRKFNGVALHPYTSYLPRTAGRRSKKSATC